MIFHQDSERKVRRQIAKVVTVMTGGLTLLSSAYGLYWNYRSLAKALGGGYEDLIRQYQLPNFYYWFYLMLGVSVVCSVLLLWCGLDQVLVRLARVRLFISVVGFELIYILFVGMILWPSRKIGATVAAATGAGLQGLWPPYYILLPVWAPLLILWARKNLGKGKIEEGVKLS